MPEFPSNEWMAALCARVAAHEEAGDIARALDGTYEFVIEPDGPLRARERYAVQITPDGAGGADARVVDPDAAAPRVSFTAKFGRWWQLVGGDLDPVLAVMLRRLKVSGDLSAVTRERGASKPLLAAVREVDAEWPDR